MSRRAAGLLVAVLTATAAVIWSATRWVTTQPRAGPAGDVVRIGANVGTLELTELDGRPFLVADHAQHAATVVWFWSVLCPCVEECEGRIRALVSRYGERGVRLLVVHPIDEDANEDIEAKRARLGSDYIVRRDRGGRLARRLGITNSGSVAVLDREGRLRFRGALDDDLDAPKVSYAGDALDALLAGKEVPLVEAPPTYGCVYRP
jgi:hypothetical protein